MSHDRKNIYYSEYLRLDAILNAQHPESANYGEPAHDETLFIITHQAYELWFKQIIHELKSILELFSMVPLDEKNIFKMVDRLGRVLKIQTLINQQIGILETMTPLDFLDFRDYLTPSSGFQSVQFREIELRLGLAHHLLEKVYGRLKDSDRQHLDEVATQKSLFEYMEAWLLRTPFLNFEDFDFWQSYIAAVKKMFRRDTATIRQNPFLSDAEKSQQIGDLASTQQSFNCLFDTELYERYQSQGRFRLSHAAIRAALFIRLYRDEPLLQLPYRLLSRLMDIDEQLTAWRSGHAIMVQRMLGTKIGTGGSSGHEYLKSTISGRRIFTDLFNLSSFLIPRSQLPSLPEGLQRNLGYAK